MALAIRNEAVELSDAEIIAALENAQSLPEVALRQAVHRAGEIAPAVIEVVEQATHGVHLLPRQENLLLWGVHAMAAAGRKELYRPLIRLLRECPEHRLDRLLGDCTTETIAGVIVAVFDGDPAALIDACSDNEIDGFLRWTLMKALARLTFDGKIARSATFGFLDRFERETLAAPGDAAWEGWQDGIVLLGLEEMRERLRATWEDGRNPCGQQDRDYVERDLSVAQGLASGDAALFDKYGIVALSDPVKALHWMAPREPNGGLTADNPGDDDPASVVALRDFEVRWLTGFLRSDKVPPGAMTFEQVDGFFCALIAGPVGAQLADNMLALWDEDDDAKAEPSYDSPEQAEYAEGLLRRHWTAIGQRLEQSCPHDLILTEGRGNEKGWRWARGFLYGMVLRSTEWEFRLKDPTIATFAKTVITLGYSPAHAKAEDLTPQLRADILDVLPRRLVAVHHAWRGRPDPFPPTIRRGTGRGKIGRNEPCPCGSGKKYKRCCGSA